MSWTNYFQKIYLINLKHRTQRLFNSAVQLRNYNIPFEVWEATYDQNGTNGIYQTLIGIFKHCLKNGIQNVLIFEDDLNIINKGINEIMPQVIEQIPEEWMELRLGANIPQPHLATIYSDVLLRVKRMLALHASAYSRECMEAIISLPKQLPIDVSVANWIQHLGQSYCTYPFLISQRDGFSDIEQRQTFYKPFLEDRYQKVIEHLKQQHETNFPLHHDVQ